MYSIITRPVGGLLLYYTAISADHNARGCVTLNLYSFFSLVILQFIDAVNLRDFVELNLWYLDDGTLVGKQSSLSSLLSLFAT